MQFRLKTSKRTQDIYEAIYQREYLQPFALSKISISLALRSGYNSAEDDTVYDVNGLDLNRQTITSDNDLLFKALIEVNEERHISEEEYFPEVVKKYIDYGAILLEQEYRYSREIYSHLVNLDAGI
ncbi:MAG: DndE family protein [Lachnospiraceae bacterium]|nr:DndE family protein [Lachnospiraceae bacterium]MCM1192461.1 DndE family protein [Acetatifactor muris]